MEQLNFWTIFNTLLIFYFGYKVGQHYTALKITRMLIERDPELERQLEKARREIDNMSKTENNSNQNEEMAVERHGEQIYLFTKSNREFLAQGSNLQEALDRVEQRFPGRKFRGHLTKEQADSLGVNIE